MGRAMSTPIPNTVEELVQLWRASDARAWSEAEIRSSKEKIRETLRRFKRDDEAER
jgi:geranylgeranyl pyrophosphate synthase